MGRFPDRDRWRTGAQSLDGMSKGGIYMAGFRKIPYDRVSKIPYDRVSKIPYDRVSKFSIEKSKMHSTKSQKIEYRR